MFKEINYNIEQFKYTINKVLNLNDDNLNYFLELINSNYISISGSSILQLIKNTIYENSDIDIYINIKKFKLNRILLIIDFIYRYFYNIENYTNNQKYIKIIKQLKYFYNKINSNSNEINYETNNEYHSLRKYLKLLLTFENDNKKQIQLIFINCDIETILLHTFDYDIVKNYYKNKKIYSNNMNAIINNIATMSLNHFINRVLSNHHEFNNFIKRYIKYNNRGFKVFIHKTLITPPIIIYIMRFYKSKNYFDDTLYYLPSWAYLNGRGYYPVYISTYIYYNNEVKNIPLEKKDHIVKYILINYLFQYKKVIKILNNYSNYLLEDYLHPESPFIKYKMNLLSNNKLIEKNNNTYLYYISSENKLKRFKFYV